MQNARFFTDQIELLKKQIRQLTILSARSESTGGFTRIAFADLPTPNLSGGRAFYVTNGRKAGEGVGAGTGMLAIETNLSGVATWVRADDMTQAVQA